MDKFYLNQALELAKTRQGTCAPNPAVGAVVVKDGNILSTGVHLGCGTPHAESEALSAAGERAQGATLYVTLEPCCHWGKTPPCSEQIIKAGIARLVYAFEDPNPEVSGRGVQQCREAGIQCDYLPMTEVDIFYRAYQYWCKTKMPWALFKLAISLDGHIAGPEGKRQQITGDKLNRLTQLNRARADAILTTGKTIIADDPKLNCRLGRTEIAKPVYVLDTQAQCPPNAMIFTTAASVTILHASNADPERVAKLQAHGARCVVLDTTADGLDLHAALKTIADDGKHLCWIEAGGRLFNHLLQADLLQQAYLYCGNQVLSTQGYSGFHQHWNFNELANHLHWHSLGTEVYCEMLFGETTCLPA